MPPNRPDEAIAFENSCNRIIETTPYFDIQVSKDALFDGAYQVVSSVFTHWKQQDLDFFQCKDGITNQCKSVPFFVI
jgi:ethanolamine kinase